MYNQHVFYSFPYQLAGFTHDEWEAMPRGDRVLIRDYYLNGEDADQTAIYNEYETMHQVWKIKRDHNMDTRPNIKITYSDLHIVV